MVFTGLNCIQSSLFLLVLCSLYITSVVTAYGSSRLCCFFKDVQPSAPPSIIVSALIAPHRPQFNRAISSRGGPYAQRMCCFNQHWLLWLHFCCETWPPLFTSCAELSTWPCCALSLGFTLQRANQLALYAPYHSRTVQQPGCQTPVTHTQFQYHWGL